MKALFVGLGSIGTRHVNNLCRLCREKGLPLEITALRGGGRPLPEALEGCVHRQVGTLAEGESFDVAFITNPTQLHAMAIGQLKGRVDTFFIEKPIFEHPDYDLELLGLSAGQKAYVAAPMRWTGVFLALREWLEAGTPVYSARAICSSYLPDWRPGVDYRSVYSARRALGGGVTLDLIHEWDYLYELFGPPLARCNLRGKYSALEIDADDLSVYIAQWLGLLGEVHLDYFGRGYRRTLELMCLEGTLVADFGTGRLTLPDGGVVDREEEANARYLREMDYFLSYALEGGGESVNSPKRALDVLKIALGEEICRND